MAEVRVAFIAAREVSANDRQDDLYRRQVAEVELTQAMGSVGSSDDLRTVLRAHETTNVPQVCAARLELEQREAAEQAFAQALTNRSSSVALRAVLAEFEDAKVPQVYIATVEIRNREIAEHQASKTTSPDDPVATRNCEAAEQKFKDAISSILSAADLEAMLSEHEPSSVSEVSSAQIEIQNRVAAEQVLAKATGDGGSADALRQVLHQYQDAKVPQVYLAMIELKNRETAEAAPADTGPCKKETVETELSKAIDMVSSSDEFRKVLQAHEYTEVPKIDEARIELQKRERAEVALSEAMANGADLWTLLEEYKDVNVPLVYKATMQAKNRHTAEYYDVRQEEMRRKQVAEVQLSKAMSVVSSSKEIEAILREHEGTNVPQVYSAQIELRSRTAAEKAFRKALTDEARDQRALDALRQVLEAYEDVKVPEVFVAMVELKNREGRQQAEEQERRSKAELEIIQAISSVSPAVDFQKVLELHEHSNVEQVQDAKDELQRRKQAEQDLSTAIADGRSITLRVALEKHENSKVPQLYTAIVELRNLEIAEHKVAERAAMVQKKESRKKQVAEVELAKALSTVSPSAELRKVLQEHEATNVPQVYAVQMEIQNREGAERALDQAMIDWQSASALKAVLQEYEDAKVPQVYQATIEIGNRELAEHQVASAARRKQVAEFELGKAISTVSSSAELKEVMQTFEDTKVPLLEAANQELQSREEAEQALTTAIADSQSAASLAAVLERYTDAKVPQVYMVMIALNQREAEEERVVEPAQQQVIDARSIAESELKNAMDTVSCADDLRLKMQELADIVQFDSAQSELETRVRAEEALSKALAQPSSDLGVVLQEHQKAKLPMVYVAQTELKRREIAEHQRHEKEAELKMEQERVEERAEQAVPLLFATAKHADHPTVILKDVIGGKNLWAVWNGFGCEILEERDGHVLARLGDKQGWGKKDNFAVLNQALGSHSKPDNEAPITDGASVVLTEYAGHRVA